MLASSNDNATHCQYPFQFRLTGASIELDTKMYVKTPLLDRWLSLHSFSLYPPPMRTKSRSARKKKDQLEFPIRIRVMVPEMGYGVLYNEIREWLEEHAGRGNFAWHSDMQPGADASAFYFKDARLIQPFLDRFGLELAIGPFF